MSDRWESKMQSKLSLKNNDRRASSHGNLRQVHGGSVRRLHANSFRSLHKNAFRGLVLPIPVIDVAVNSTATTGRPIRLNGPRRHITRALARSSRRGALYLALWAEKLSVRHLPHKGIRALYYLQQQPLCHKQPYQSNRFLTTL